MPAETPKLRIPYPLPSDAVVDYPALGQDLAELLETLLASSVPTGAVTAFAGVAAPEGWLLCDGSAVDRVEYAALFAVIGETYGAGDGSTTFLLPDLRGRVPAGLGAGAFDVLGEKLGAEEVALTVAELPAHAHAFAGTAMPAHAHNIVVRAVTLNNSITTGGAVTYVNDVQDATGVTSGADKPPKPVVSASAGTPAGTIGNTGAGETHANLQPSLVVNYIVKA